jgi:hypothetical protein
MSKVGRIGSTFAQDCVPTAVINTFADPLNRSLWLETRKGLRDRRERQVAKVLKAPQTFTAPFNALADSARDTSGFRSGLTSHGAILALAAALIMPSSSAPSSKQMRQ